MVYYPSPAYPSQPTPSHPSPGCIPYSPQWSNIWLFNSFLFSIRITYLFWSWACPTPSWLLSSLHLWPCTLGLVILCGCIRCSVYISRSTAVVGSCGPKCSTGNNKCNLHCDFFELAFWRGFVTRISLSFGKNYAKIICRELHQCTTLFLNI